MNPHANKSHGELFQFADDFDTLADIALINDRNLADIEGISDLLQEAPVLQLLSATTASNGNVHQYEKEIAAPSVGFRSANDGIEHSKDGNEIVTVTLEFLDPHTRVDKAVAATYAGRRGGTEGYLARKNKRHLKAGFATLERQMFYGGDNDATGFVGLSQSLNDLDIETVIDGGGANNLSSVWMIRTNDDHTDVSAVFGSDGNITIGTPMLQEVTLANGKHQMAWVTDIGAYAGIQVGGKYSAVRIANVENLDDDLLSRGLELFPSGKGPTFIAMTRQKRGTLQRSRTPHHPAGHPVPVPRDYEDIPIVTTDQLRNDETAVAA